MAKNTYLKFDIAVRNYYGSNNAAIAFARLLYWFNRKPQGFYKFKQPCKHPLYKKGDSWGEEIGMTRWELDPIFKRLINHHASKSQYRKSTDKFNGKMFCSYKDCKDNRTYYFMDKDKVDAFLASLSDQPKILPSAPSRNVVTTPPLTHAHTPSSVLQTITSLPGDVPEAVEVETDEEKLSSKKMVELWNSHTQDKVVWYASTASKLYKILKDFFGGCLEAFRKYCSAISKVPFLMGKAPNSKFKAFFYWVIKPEVIKSIFQGAYGVKDIISQIGNVSEQDKLQYEINTIGYEVSNVEKAIERSKEQVIEDQNKLIQEHKETMSEVVKDEIFETVEREIDQKYPLGVYSQRDRDMLTSIHYHTALINHCRTELKLCNPEDIVVSSELLTKKQSLQEKRAALCKRLEQVIKENLRAQQSIEKLVEKAA